MASSLYERDVEPTFLVAKSPTQLENAISQGRQAVTRYTGFGVRQVREGRNYLQRQEVYFQDTLHALWAKDEEPVPALLFVGVAGLAGAIVSRNRNFLLRGVIPSLATLGALAYFLPHTTANLNQRLLAAERMHAPNLANLHERSLEQISSLSSKLASTAYKSGGISNDALGSGRQVLDSWLGRQKTARIENQSGTTSTKQ